MKVTTYAGETLPVTPGESPWFVNQKPPEEGVYKRWFPNLGIRHSMWKNGQWMIAGLDVKSAARSHVPSGYQKFPWCGLAENPNAR